MGSRRYLLESVLHSFVRFSSPESSLQSRLTTHPVLVHSHRGVHRSP